MSRSDPTWQLDIWSQTAQANILHKITREWASKYPWPLLVSLWVNSSHTSVKMKSQSKLGATWHAVTTLSSMEQQELVVQIQRLTRVLLRWLTTGLATKTKTMALANSRISIVKSMVTHLKVSVITRSGPKEVMAGQLHLVCYQRRDLAVVANSLTTINKCRHLWDALETVSMEEAVILLLIRQITSKTQAIQQEEMDQESFLINLILWKTKQSLILRQITDRARVGKTHSIQRIANMTTFLLIILFSHLLVANSLILQTQLLSRAWARVELESFNLI